MNQQWSKSDVQIQKEIQGKIYLAVIVIYTQTPELWRILTLSSTTTLSILNSVKCYKNVHILCYIEAPNDSSPKIIVAIIGVF